MNKKKLPKAIRSTVKKPATETAPASRTLASDAGKVSPSRSKARATPDVADGDRRSRATKVVERFSFWSGVAGDRKSTRLNSSHPSISYAVFCLKKKKQHRLG